MSENIVSIVMCKSYAPESVYNAVKKAYEASGGFEVKGKTLLIKPNILSGAEPEKAVCTHPEFVRQAIRFFYDKGAEKIYAGDSPGFQSTEYAGKKSGIKEAALDAGAQWADFSSYSDLENPEGKLVKRFQAADVLKKVDAVVSLPKMKTHQLLYFTGGMKNLFGLVPGLQKSQFHLRFPDKKNFAQMITDLNIAVKPVFTLMDGIVSMEGPGPGNGIPRETGLVLASGNILALDTAVSRIMGYKAEEMPLLESALETGKWMKTLDDYRVNGDFSEEPVIEDYKQIKVLNDISMFREKMPDFIFRFLKEISIRKPVFIHKKCIRCGDCIKICPADALSFSKDTDKKVEINYKKCIRCYCCHEVCPVDAIIIKRKIL
jgi:uncharacterized protein (DUF362 family)/Pyruvate/2-oxoacid:ferredoxin oxidoreductase delta subunit